MTVQFDGYSSLNSLNELQWHKRVILINPSCDKAVTASDYARLLSSYQDEIEERDILWFVAANEHLLTNYQGHMAEGLQSVVRKRFSQQVCGKQTEVLLIGKDGGIKSQQNTLNAELIFDLIDSMPMRRREMRQ